MKKTRYVLLGWLAESLQFSSECGIIYEMVKKTAVDQ